MLLAFSLADRWGEPDPRKILALPAPFLMMWQAFITMLNDRETASDGTSSEDRAPIDDECAAFMRVMK